jgi:hypothetical protein
MPPWILLELQINENENENSVPGQELSLLTGFSCVGLLYLVGEYVQSPERFH